MYPNRARKSQGPIASPTIPAVPKYRPKAATIPITINPRLIKSDLCPPNADFSEPLKALIVDFFCFPSLFGVSEVAPLEGIVVFLDFRLPGFGPFSDAFSCFFYLATIRQR